MSLLALASLELFSGVALVALERLRGLRYFPLPAQFEMPAQADLQKLLENRTAYCDYDAELGWRLRPHGREPGCSANSLGFRGPEPLRRRPVVAAFGDSFTHGDEVSDEHTWESYWQRESSQVEVENYGVNGYGTDQAWLRYRQQKRDDPNFNPRVVLIGYHSDHGLRMLTSFPLFYFGIGGQHGISLPKPRFRATSGLELVPNPCGQREQIADYLRDPQKSWARLGRDDPFYVFRLRRRPWDSALTGRLACLLFDRLLSPYGGEYAISEGHWVYRPESRSYRLARLVLTEFYREVERDGRHPVLVFFPGRSDLLEARAIYQPLLTELKRSGMHTEDLLPMMLQSRLPASQWFGQSHYLAAGNQRVANWLRLRIEPSLPAQAVRATPGNAGLQPTNPDRRPRRAPLS